MKNVSVLLTTIILLSLSGCSTSIGLHDPKIRKEIKNTAPYNVTIEDVCRDNKDLLYEKEGATWCRDDMINEDHIKVSRRKKSLEEAAIGAEERTAERKIAEAKWLEERKIAEAKTAAERKIVRVDVFEKMWAEDRAEAKAKDVEFDSVVSDPTVKMRINKLGWTVEQFKEKMIDNYSDSYSSLGQITGFLDSRERVEEDKIKEEALEKTAKIQKGKQYICSDGHDSWVLKFNGYQIIFGDVNFEKTIFGGYAQPNRKQDITDMLIIDRVKSTVTYHGNKSTCKPR